MLGKSDYNLYWVCWLQQHVHDIFARVATIVQQHCCSLTNLMPLLHGEHMITHA
jgi:hypothetical protein